MMEISIQDILNTRIGIYFFFVFSELLFARLVTPKHNYTSFGELNHRVFVLFIIISAMLNSNFANRAQKEKKNQLYGKHVVCCSS